MEEERMRVFGKHGLWNCMRVSCCASVKLHCGEHVCMACMPMLQMVHPAMHMCAVSTA